MDFDNLLALMLTFKFKIKVSSPNRGLITNTHLLIMCFGKFAQKFALKWGSNSSAIWGILKDLLSLRGSFLLVTTRLKILVWR